MEAKKLQILIIENSEDDALLLIRQIEKGGYEVSSLRVEATPAMIAAMDDKNWDLILADYSLPEFSGLEALEIFKSKKLDIPFILVSGSVGEELAVQAMKQGAHDFITKDNLERLTPAVTRELNECKVRERLRESEHKFNQAQKMEGVGRLAGGVAHDFNNILAVVMMNSEIILKNLPESDKSFQAAMQIKKAAERGAGLTKQLLAFCRKQVLEPKVINLNAVTLDMERMLGHLIGKDIELSSSLMDQLGHIKADYGQIEQVIMNLAINSRDAMPNGGKLCFATKNIEIDQALSKEMDIPPGDYVAMVINDSGTGMSEKIQEKIFDPFFTTKSKDKGTGLGLSTVQGIISQSGGYIRVASKVDQGTEFQILFPRVDLPLSESPLESHAKEPATGVNETIVLLEDEASLCEAITTILEDEGYRVVTPSSGAGALALAQETNAHLLLTDVVLPEMSGSEVAKIISEKEPNIKILFMSGYLGEMLSHHDLLKEKAQFLQKPFTKIQLTEKVRQVLRP